MPKYYDVRDVSGHELTPVDCINFGSPCQDLSVAGRRKGLDGERSGLFHEAMRIIKEMRDATRGAFPRLAIWENVPGALTSNGGADFGVVLDEMAKSGSLAVEWAVLDAQYFGIPQRRRRVFVCAQYDPVATERSSFPILPVSEGMRRHNQKSRQKKQEVADEVEESPRISDSQISISEGLMGLSEHDSDNHGVSRSYQELVGTLAARDYKGVGSQYVSEDKLVVEEERFVFHPHRQDGVRMQGDTINTLTAFMGTGGLNTPMVAQGPSRDVLNDGIAMTLRSGGDGGVPSSRGENLVIDPSESSTMIVRRLTPGECELLMGWPLDHTRWQDDGKEQKDTHRYKQCGNGVAAPVAKWIGTKYAEVLSVD